MGETEQGLSWFPRPPPAHTATYCKILKKKQKKTSYANNKSQTNEKNPAADVKWEKSQRRSSILQYRKIINPQAKYPL